MSLAHPHFAEPRWLWLAVLAPLLLAALQWYSSMARKKQLAQLAAPHFLAELTRSHSPLRRAIKNVLVILAVTGLGLSLARPQWGEQEESGQMLGEDIVFVLDCSRSMLAADVSPIVTRPTASHAKNRSRRRNLVARTAPVARSECDPPFVVDAYGIKRMKVSCF